MTAALHMQGVTKKFGRISALDAFDLEVPHGSIFGLVGSNGAGKTTAMTVALGLLHANVGQIDVLDAGPFRPATHTGRVALLPQDAAEPSPLWPGRQAVQSASKQSLLLLKSSRWFHSGGESGKRRRFLHLW